MPRVKKQAVDAANSQQEAERLIDNIGRNQQEIKRIEADMNDTIASIKAEFERKAQPLNQQINDSFEAVQQWAEANRDRLCNKGIKSAKLATGSISWRMTTPKVSIRGVDAVLDKLKALKAHSFIRLKQEINKDAILANQEQVEALNIPGITISQREEFAITPFETELEKAAING